MRHLGTLEDERLAEVLLSVAWVIDLFGSPGPEAL
jgi:hypothetical protein